MKYLGKEIVFACPLRRAVEGNKTGAPKDEEVVFGTRSGR